MFYSLETNQIKKIKHRSRRGGQNSNIFHKTWGLCRVSKLGLVGINKDGNLVSACSAKLSLVINEMFSHVLLSVPVIVAEKLRKTHNIR